MTIPQDMKAELLNIVRAELDQKEQEKTANRSMYRRICSGLENQLNAFDYAKVHQRVKDDGTTSQWDYPLSVGWKIRGAIGTLLRIIYRVDATAKLPADQEQNISSFVVSILEMMKRTSPFLNTDN